MIPHGKELKNKVNSVVDDQYGRRKWNVSHEVSTKEDPSDLIPKSTQFLQTRNLSINLDSLVGKSTLINKELNNEKQSGFYCDKCEFLCKDSNTYLDHLNSASHNRKFGFNMKVEKVDADRVRQRFQLLKNRSSNIQLPSKESEEEPNRQLEEREKLREERKENKKRKKKSSELNKEIEESLLENADELSIMGFPSGLGVKKPKTN